MTIYCQLDFSKIGKIDHSEMSREIPLEIQEEAAAATQNLLPTITRERYQQEYDNFLKWRQDRSINSVNEAVLLAYEDYRFLRTTSALLISMFIIMKNEF